MTKAPSGNHLNEVPEIVLEHHQRTLAGPMREWTQRKHIPPTLLLTGQTGIGKRSAAYFLGRWILCENNQELKPCETCSSCKKTKARNDVNLIEMTPPSDDESANQTLKIDQFRNLKASSGWGAYEGTHKVILIPDAERMTPQAANSVLKLLEEPPAGWIFFLTASDPTLLLPTLVSRCQILRLKPFSTEQIRTFLQTTGIDSNRHEVCAHLSQGSWSRALIFADDDMWKHRKIFFQFFKDPASVVNSLVEWATQEPSHLEALLDLLEQVTSDLLRWSTLPHSQWIHSDQQEDLMTHAEQLIHKTGSLKKARQFWLNRAERLSQARQDLTTAVNRKLLVQDLLLPWIGALS